MAHVSQQFTPPQLLEAGHRAEAEGRLDLAVQFYRHLTEYHAFTGEAAEARNGLGRVGAAQSQQWQANGAAPANGSAAPRAMRRRPVVPRDHYRAGRLLARLLSALGWLAVAGGLAAPGISLGLPHVLPGLNVPRIEVTALAAVAASAMASGLLMMLLGQLARAVFDSANAARDLAAIERAKMHAE